MTIFSGQVQKQWLDQAFEEKAETVLIQDEPGNYLGMKKKACAVCKNWEAKSMRMKKKTYFDLNCYSILVESHWIFIFAYKWRGIYIALERTKLSYTGEGAHTDQYKL